MTEYLSSQELHQLTGYARSGQQSAWLKFPAARRAGSSPASGTIGFLLWF